MTAKSPRLAGMASLLVLGAGIQAASLQKSNSPEIVCGGIVVCQSVVVTFSEGGFLPYGGSLAGGFAGTLVDGQVLYNVGDDIGTVTSSYAFFTGNFPGSPDVTVNLGPATSIQYGLGNFIFDFDGTTLALPGNGNCEGNYPCFGYLFNPPYNQYSPEYPSYNVTPVPEPAFLGFVGAAGCLALLWQRNWRRGTV